MAIYLMDKNTPTDLKNLSGLIVCLRGELPPASKLPYENQPFPSAFLL